MNVNRKITYDGNNEVIGINVHESMVSTTCQLDAEGRRPDGRYVTKRETADSVAIVLEIKAPDSEGGPYNVEYTYTVEVC